MSHSRERENVDCKVNHTLFSTFFLLSQQEFHCKQEHAVIIDEVRTQNEILPKVAATHWTTTTPSTNFHMSYAWTYPFIYPGHHFPHAYRDIFEGDRRNEPTAPSAYI